nr:reverse transcriptase domain-containing protein [Tanacetum cinerariifolium]
ICLKFDLPVQPRWENDPGRLGAASDLLTAPTEGYEDAIVVPAITADNFELKHGLLTLFFPPSKTTNLRNEITNFQQRFVETFSEAWDRFKDLLRACPHHGFSELHQLDTFYNALNSKDQDSLNSAAGGNILDKMPRECLGIIESTSKVCYSRNKPVVAKVSTTASTSGISPDVAELKDMVRALLLDKKGQSSALVKAVEESCVTCGGANSYRNFPATDGNNYRDNIQEFIRPPGFPPVPNNQNLQRNNQNRFIPNQNQNRGNKFHQGPVYQPSVFQPPVYQAPAYQALAPQTQGVSKEDLSAYVKANDTVMRNMQTQGQIMQNQLTNLTDLITKFVNSNTASTSNSGILPSNTIANPRSDLKAIMTRSGVSYDGPQISPPPSSLSPVVEDKPEATKDTVDPTNNGNTKDVQPQVVHPKPVTSPISEPVITPVSASRPNPNASIPYLSKRNDERNRERAKDQIEKFYQIFKELSFEISFADALMLMPKFASTLKALIENKEKLSEMAQTPLNEHCSVVLLKKLPEKLGDPCKFLIPCDFPGMVECLALADLGVSINLMPYYVWKRLSLSDLTPTCMTLELADRSIISPVGITEDVYVKKLSDIKGINPEFCTHKILMKKEFEPEVQHQRRVNPKIHDVIKQKVIKLLEARLIYPISDSPWVSPVHCVPKKGGFTVVENEDNELIPTRLVTGWRVCIDYRKLNEATQKDHFPLSFMDQMLERLAENQYYCFLDGFSGYFQIPIDPKDQEKTTFTCPYGTFAYRRMPFGLCNAPGTFQRCMMAIFHDMIEKTMEVFMDDFSVFRNSFQRYLSHLDQMLKRCEDNNLCLNWDKSHFMVKEVIDTKRAENLAADHLSRLENPHQNVLDPKEINESFHLETLNMVSTRGNQSFPWFADFANYHAGNFIVKGMSSQQKNKFFKDVKHYFWDDPLKFVLMKSSRGVYLVKKPLIYSRLATLDQLEVTMDLITQPERCLIQDFIGPLYTVIPRTLSKIATFFSVKAKFHRRMRCHKISSKCAKFLISGGFNLWARFHHQEETNTYSLQSTICQNGWKLRHSPQMTLE